jgi:hypothetical protein
MRGFLHTHPSIALVRFLVEIFIAALLFCGVQAQGVELLKRVVFFDPPQFLKADPTNSDPAFVASYTGRDNAPGKSFRFLGMSTRPVGFDKQGKDHPIDEKSLKQEMTNFYAAWKTHRENIITHVSEITPVTLGGQRALKINFDMPDPGYYQTGLCQNEQYWVQYDSNLVVWISLSANTENGLKSLRDSLSTLRIVRQTK